MRLKHYCADAGQYGVNVSPDEYGVEGLRMVRTSDLTNSGLRPADEGVFIQVPVPAVQVLEPGDILLSRAGTIGRSYLVPDEAAGHTFAGFLVRFRPGSGADPRFVTYAIQSTPVQQQITADAVTSTISNFNADKYANLELPTAPLEEQRRIADFLDDRVARIDQIIAGRQQQLSLAGAIRQRRVADLLLHKEAGWINGPLRRFVRSEDSVRIPLSTQERETRQGAYPYYGASGVIDHVDDYLFDGPRVLLSEDGANLLLRSTPIAFVADGQYWVNNHAHILQPFDGAHDFWAARIEAMSVAPWVSGSAQPKLTIDAALSLPVSAPRDEEARRVLGKEVRHIASDVMKSAEVLTRQVHLWQEYKQSLITAAVTGEFDVTTAAPIPE